ncbi:hypothetical protein E4U03_00545 [Rothia nasimurium]|uniref:Uncharacterized protein n=1 Tax=Rothia nasimurium TaxID=85336 RepID=A0A4Y9F6T3_9MICC|nr:hypothetical protein [Rothia nasimurium]MBF0807113.1 hypothetical protein [Rothia nasimurium]TFU24431.1 hypothetical protein E4U03_00545 [Rothia nasimurium]
MTDGLTDREATEQKTSPARPEQLTAGLPATSSAATKRSEHQSPEEKSPIINGVKLSALRSMLEAKHGFSLGHINDAALGQMVTIVISRASAPVRSPLAFAITAISSEIEELHSLALSLLEAEATQSAPREFCNTHTREFTGSCPLCAKEATGQLKILTPESSESAPVDRQAGVAFRESIRARRKTKNGSPVKNSAQEHPGLGGRIPLKSLQGPLRRPESPSVA